MSPTFVIAKPPAREVLKPEFTARGRFSHRIVVFDGPPDNALLEALWNGHTVPAVVTLTPTER